MPGVRVPLTLHEQDELLDLTRGSVCDLERRLFWIILSGDERGVTLQPEDIAFLRSCRAHEFGIPAPLVNFIRRVDST